MEIIHVTEATFKQEVLESDKPVLLGNMVWTLPDACTSP